MINTFTTQIQTRDRPIYVQEVFAHLGHGEYSLKYTHKRSIQRLYEHINELMHITHTIHQNSELKENTITRLMVNEFGFYTRNSPLSILQFTDVVKTIYQFASRINGNVHFLLSSFPILWPNATLQNGLLYVQGGLNTSSNTPTIRFFSKEHAAIGDLSYENPNLKNERYKFTPNSASSSDIKFHPKVVFKSLYDLNILEDSNQYKSCFPISTTLGAKAFVTVDVCFDHVEKTAFKNLNQAIESELSNSSLIPLTVNHLISSSAIRNRPQNVQASIIHISTNESFEMVGHLHKKQFSKCIRKKLKELLKRKTSCSTLYFDCSKKIAMLMNPKFGTKCEFEIYPSKLIGLLKPSLLSDVLTHTQKCFPIIKNASIKRINFSHPDSQCFLHLELNKTHPKLYRIKSLIKHKADFFVFNNDLKMPLDYLFSHPPNFINPVIKTLGTIYNLEHIQIHNEHFYQLVFKTCPLSTFSKLLFYRQTLKRSKNSHIKQNLLKTAIQLKEIEKVKFILTEFNFSNTDFLNEVITDLVNDLKYSIVDVIIRCYPQAINHPSIQSAKDKIQAHLKESSITQHLKSLNNMAIPYIFYNCLYLVELAPLKGMSLKMSQLNLALKPDIDHNTLKKIEVLIVQLKYAVNLSKFLNEVYEKFSRQSLEKLLNSNTIEKFPAESIERLMSQAIKEDNVYKFQELYKYYQKNYPDFQLVTHPLKRQLKINWIMEIINHECWSILLILPTAYRALLPLKNNFFAKGFLKPEMNAQSRLRRIQAYPEKAKKARLLKKECKKVKFCKETILTLLDVDSLVESNQAECPLDYLIPNLILKDPKLNFLNEMDKHLIKNKKKPLLYQILKFMKMDIYTIIQKQPHSLKLESPELNQKLMIRFILHSSLSHLKTFIKFNPKFDTYMTEKFKAQFHNWAFFSLWMRKERPLKAFIQKEPRVLYQPFKGRLLIDRIESYFGKTFADNLRVAYPNTKPFISNRKL